MTDLSACVHFTGHLEELHGETSDPSGVEAGIVSSVRSVLPEGRLQLRLQGEVSSGSRANDVENRPPPETGPRLGPVPHSNREELRRRGRGSESLARPWGPAST